MRLFLSLGNFERATLTVYSHAATRRIGIEAMVIAFMVATTRYGGRKGRGGSASIRRGDKSSEATLAEFSSLEKKQIIMGPCCGFLPTKFKVAYIAKTRGRFSLNRAPTPTSIFYFHMILDELTMRDE